MHIYAHCCSMFGPQLALTMENQQGELMTQLVQSNELVNGYGEPISGWWFQPTPLKNMSSSDWMIIPNIWKVIKAMFQTTNQFLSV